MCLTMITNSLEKFNGDHGRRRESVPKTSYPMIVGAKRDQVHFQSLIAEPDLVGVRVG